jgi:hypothetical protein
MSANGYAVIGVFLDLLRFGAASMAVALGTRTLFSMARSSRESSGVRSALESRAYLSALLAYLLLGLALASWILLYLLLDSLVPESPGAMCIYGVTRVGEGSPGLAGWLPALITGVQLIKPVLVFVAGAVVVLYLLYRRAGTQALLPRFVAGLLVLGVLALADVAAESAYLLIPKRDVPNAGGCCSVAADELRAQPPQPDEQRWLTPAYFACQLLMAGSLWSAAHSNWHTTNLAAANQGAAMQGAANQAAVSAWKLLILLAASAVTLCVAARFLVDIAAPALLHLPYHHCLYDLVGTVRESAVAIGLLLWGTFCVGWACVAGWCGRTGDSLPFLAAEVRRLLSWAGWGYLGSAAMFAVDLWLALQV